MSQIFQDASLLGYLDLTFVYVIRFHIAIQKLKDQDIQNYNFARGFVWVWNLVADIEGGMQAEGVEESIWT